MKVVVAIDSLKGSLSSMQAGHIIKKAILKVKPSAQVVVKPLADGGEGTTDALTEGFHGETQCLSVTGPLGSPVSACYGYVKETQTAIMEMASASGITLIPTAERNPLLATTRGTGEMILHAMNLGCRNFIIGIGGSATNDGGIGMLQALGWRFLDKDSQDVGEGAQALGKIVTIDTTNVHPELSNCKFKIACDVTNPLCGPTGATYVFGPQKGVTEGLKDSIDQAMAHYASVTERLLGTSYQNSKGAGAAGGMGFAFQSYLHAQLVPGIDLVLDAIQLEQELMDADIVITGEGRLDHQTAMGKAPIGVAKLAKKHHAKVIAFAGSVTPDAVECNVAGIDAFFPIIRGISTLEEAMHPETASANLFATVEQVFRLI